MASAPGESTRMRRIASSGNRLLGSTAFVALVVAVGALFRIVQFLSGRSLWLDEALLSLNIIHQPFSRLFGTLDYVQGAPPGFLLFDRLAVDAFGSSEAALRLVPLLAGLASLPLFFLVAKQVLPPAGAGAALVLFAALDGPIIYSSEVKQYSSDICFTLAVLAAGLAAADRKLTRRRTIGLAAVGAVAVWFSHPVTFVLAGIGVSLLVPAVLARDRARLERLAPVFAIWAASFAGVYLVNIRHLPKGLGTYFLVIPPTSGQDVTTAARSFEGLVAGELSLHLPAPLAVVGGMLVVIGAWWLGRRSPVRLSMLLLPVPIAAAASGAGDYPWGGRFTLFLVPIVLLLAVAGGVAIANGPWRLARTVAVVLVVAIGLPSLATAGWHLLKPQRIEEIVPAVQTLEARYRNGDTIYMNATAQYALRYYAVDRHLGDRLPIVIDRAQHRAIRPKFPAVVIGSDEIDPRAVPRRSRVWVLLAHFTLADPEEFLRRLDREGRRLLTETQPGVVLALFDLRASSRSAPTASR